MKCEPIFIYALCEPGTYLVRYVGMTTNLPKRLRAHISGSAKQSSRLGDWIRELISERLLPEIQLLVTSSRRTWRADEARCIRVARELGYDLVNGNNGGGGQPHLSQDHRARISATMKGRRPTDACLAAARARNLGSKKTPEHRAKLSVAHRGMPWTPAQHAAGRGKQVTPEHRAKLSAANKGVPWSAARRAAYERSLGD